MPGIFAAIMSMIVIPTMGAQGFPEDYFTITKDGGSWGDQVYA
jgi:hypothetical protein